MNISGWLQLAAFLAVLVLATKPMGIYLGRVLDAQGTTFLSPVVGPLERLLYRVIGVDPGVEQDWKQYTVSILVFSTVTWCRRE
jgi:potassium-transporting ATPase potassium-binding subunit